jgi:LemA protein
MKQKVLLSLIIIVAIIVVASKSSILIYNGLVEAEKGVDEAKAQVETVYQRKLDLIPNLVETVKGYAEHEQETLVVIVKARGKAQGVLEEIGTEKSFNQKQMTELASSQSELTGALKSLFALVENHPDLKASTNFLVLQDQLEGTENRITVARQRYNSSVRYYDTKVATFPQNIIAFLFGFKEKGDYFEAVEHSEKSMEIKF